MCKGGEMFEKTDDLPPKLPMGEYGGIISKVVLICNSIFKV